MMGFFPGSKLCTSLGVLRFLKRSKDRALAQALLKDCLAPDHSIRPCDESSAAQTPFIFTERDRQLQKSSSHELLEPACFSHQWQRKPKESIAMCCTTKIVCINRQRSASQFLGATHTPWLSQGWLHIGPVLFFISCFVFHAKEGQAKKWEGVWHHATFQDIPSKILGENLPH